MSSPCVAASLAFLVGCLGFGTAPSLAAPPKTALSLDQAQKIATGQEAGVVKSRELEKERGRWNYSFDIVREGQVHEVNVDANTGKIVEDKVESAADEAREKQQDKGANR